MSLMKIIEWVLPDLNWLADNIFNLSMGLLVIWILATLILFTIFAIVSVARRLGLLGEKY